ncbi:MAG: hypothetical protein JWL73_503 [Actinomycetia bacterium]|nr:hypothetical protein [Actinomycetes bacterium]
MLSTSDARRCLYCLEPFMSLGAVDACGDCGEHLHTECFDLNHGCTTYGCVQCEATPSGVPARADRISTGEDHTGGMLLRPVSDPEPSVAAGFVTARPAGSGSRGWASDLGSPERVPATPVRPTIVPTAVAPSVRQFCGRCGARVGMVDNYCGRCGVALPELA